MEKSIARLTYGVIVLAILLIGYIFFADSKLDDALIQLDKANSQLSDALSKVDSANIRINELHSTLSVYGLYVKDIQGRVEIENLERRLKNTTDKKERDSIRNRLKELGTTIDLTGEELPGDPVRPAIQ